MSRAWPPLTAALVLALARIPGASAAEAEPSNALLALSLEDLIKIEVTSASGLSETLMNAPAAMLVITDQDIQQRGYTDLTEVLADLPGFDTIVTNGTDQVISYQRGYRTTFTQRTLLMINGIIDNSLWAQAALISRQYPLANIERIEVLYGPAGAIYGPNAFLGVINILTKDPRKLVEGERYFSVSAQVGSYRTRGVDLAAGGSLGALRYSLSAKVFASDEADLDDYAPWGYTDPAWLDRRGTWGPVLDHSHRGIAYGRYADRSNNWGLLGEASYRDTTLGLIHWKTREGYGVFYAFDHAQPNQSWYHDSLQLYLKHDWQARSNLAVKSLLKYRSSRIWGGWAEAEPDWNPGRALASYVSISDWNSDSRAWEFRQDYDWAVNEALRFTLGVKYERKALTKAYDLCNYWSSAHCSATDNTDLGPHGLGPGIGHSGDPVLPTGPGTLSQIPADNLAHTQDRGAYVQAIWDRGRWRLSAAVRADRNSLYGSFIKPRATAIYRVSDHGVLKLLYGEAFQEPAPLQLWGGWQGRAANPELQPEEVRNLEVIYLYQRGHWFHDLSLFQALYSNVIKEEAENAGERHVRGLEYRGKYQFGNFIDGAADITGYAYYTYTRSESSIYYDHARAAWVEGWRRLGDIAEHKLNLGLDLPVSDRFGLNLRANWVSDRELYLRNPLRAEGREADSYLVFDLHLRYQAKPWAIGFKVNNLFDAEYYHPGVEQADSGDDFFDADANPQRARGYRNSLLPQVGRHYLLTFTVTI